MAGVKMSDIAQRVGVSVAAVSMALNGRPGVSDAMRERILAEAAASGYDMRRLSVASEKKTQILIYYVDYPGNGGDYDLSDIRRDFMQGIEQAAQAFKLEINYLYSKTGRIELTDIPSGTDGVLVVSVLNNDDLGMQVANCQLPCVVVGNRLPGSAIPTVSYDNQGAMEQVVRQLAAAGHRQIGFIRANTFCQNYQDRYNGWLCAIHQMGLELGPVFNGSGNLEAIYEELRLWLPQHLGETTAFVTWNDYVGLAVIRALRSCGVTPGQDVAVVGFDDMPFSTLSDPPLATVQINETALSKAGIAYLLERIQHPELPVTQRQLPLQLIWRESAY